MCCYVTYFHFKFYLIPVGHAIALANVQTFGTNEFGQLTERLLAAKMQTHRHKNTNKTIEHKSRLLFDRRGTPFSLENRLWL